MNRKMYITPQVKSMEMYAEGILCTSEEETDEPMILPGTEWKPETIW